MYYYGVKNNKGKLTIYSERFYNFKDAIKWYRNYGLKLAEMFDRKLILKNTKNI